MAVLSADAAPDLLSETPSFMLSVWVADTHWIMALFLISGVVGIASGPVFDLADWAKIVLLEGST